VKSRQQVIDDGREAKRLLEDTDLQKFMDEFERDCWEQFTKSAPDDQGGREGLYMKLQGLEAFRQKLRAMEDNATIEKNKK